MYIKYDKRILFITNLKKGKKKTVLFSNDSFFMKIFIYIFGEWIFLVKHFEINRKKE